MGQKPPQTQPGAPQLSVPGSLWDSCLGWKWIAEKGLFYCDDLESTSRGGGGGGSGIKWKHVRS